MTTSSEEFWTQFLQLVTTNGLVWFSNQLKSGGQERKPRVEFLFYLDRRVTVFQEVFTSCSGFYSNCSVIYINFYVNEKQFTNFNMSRRPPTVRTSIKSDKRARGDVMERSKKWWNK